MLGETTSEVKAITVLRDHMLNLKKAEPVKSGFPQRDGVRNNRLKTNNIKSPTNTAAHTDIT